MRSRTVPRTASRSGIAPTLRYGLAAIMTRSDAFGKRRRRTRVDPATRTEHRVGTDERETRLSPPSMSHECGRRMSLRQVHNPAFPKGRRLRSPISRALPIGGADRRLLRALARARWEAEDSPRWHWPTPRGQARGA